MRRDFQRPFSRPPGATEVILVRHGAVSRPAPGALVGGHSDPALSEAGHRQAEAVASRLADEPMQALFVTPLSRTAHTAAPLAAACGLTPIVVASLREVHVGDWEGRLQDHISAAGPIARAIFEQERWDVIPGAEPMDAFARRVEDGLRAVVDRVGPDGTGLVVTHGGVIAEACRQATGSRPFAFLGGENGSVTRLVRLEDGAWVLRSFNDTAHLSPGDAAPDGRAA